MIYAFETCVDHLQHADTHDRSASCVVGIYEGVWKYFGVLLPVERLSKNYSEHCTQEPEVKLMQSAE